MVRTVLYTDPSRPTYVIFLEEKDSAFTAHCTFAHKVPADGGVVDPYVHTVHSRFSAMSSLSHHVAIHHKGEAADIIRQMWEQQDLLRNFRRAFKGLRLTK